VKVSKVLVGTVATTQPILVCVWRSEVMFRYPLGEPFIFFLKPAEPWKHTDHPKEGDWRAVGDYFGILPHNLVVQDMIVPPPGTEPRPAPAPKPEPPQTEPSQ
jgi:hypothetical protein